MKRIAALHGTLRGMVRHSPLCDGARAARELEDVYAHMASGALTD